MNNRECITTLASLEKRVAKLEETIDTDSNVSTSEKLIEKLDALETILEMAITEMNMAWESAREYKAEVERRGERMEWLLRFIKGSDELREFKSTWFDADGKVNPKFELVEK